MPSPYNAFADNWVREFVLPTAAVEYRYLLVSRLMYLMPMQSKGVCLLGSRWERWGGFYVGHVRLLQIQHGQ